MLDCDHVSSVRSPAGSSNHPFASCNTRPPTHSAPLCLARASSLQYCSHVAGIYQPHQLLDLLRPPCCKPQSSLSCDRGQAAAPHVQPGRPWAPGRMQHAKASIRRSRCAATRSPDDLVMGAAPSGCMYVASQLCKRRTDFATSCTVQNPATPTPAKSFVTSAQAKRFACAHVRGIAGSRRGLQTR